MDLGLIGLFACLAEVQGAARFAARCGFFAMHSERGCPEEKGADEKDAREENALEEGAPWSMSNPPHSPGQVSTLVGGGQRLAIFEVRWSLALWEGAREEGALWSLRNPPFTRSGVDLGGWGPAAGKL
jgi:hypothetical protein